MSLKTSIIPNGSIYMTNAGTRTCRRLQDIPAEIDASYPSPIGDPVSCVKGRDGRDCPVWTNPSDQDAAKLLAGSRDEHSSLRAILTEHDLYVWQGKHVPHGDFVRRVGVDGVRIRLRPDMVFVNEETVGMPSAFPWIFQIDGDALDIGYRREIVEQWLQANSRLAAFYPNGFTVNWYM